MPSKALPILLLFVACAHEESPIPQSGQGAVAVSEVAQASNFNLSDAEWKKRLSKEQYEILREEGTERAFSGKYWKHTEKGTYVCAGCGAELYSSKDKFKSGTGWPSFTRAAAEGRVATHVDRSWGMSRTEIECARCGGHLGHVFNDGPEPTGKRHCVNSASLEFKAQ